VERPCERGLHCPIVSAMQRNGLAEQWRLRLMAATIDLAATEHAIDPAHPPGTTAFPECLGLRGPGHRSGQLCTATGCNKATGSVRHGLSAVGPSRNACRRRRGVAATNEARNPTGRLRGAWSLARWQRRSCALAAAVTERRTTAKKAEYLSRPRRGPSACPFGQTHMTGKGETAPCGLMHAHVAAMRYAVKLLLKDLWAAWRTVAAGESRQIIRSSEEFRLVN
jgi:hypothetical protein